MTKRTLKRWRRNPSIFVRNVNRKISAFKTSKQVFTRANHVKKYGWEKVLQSRRKAEEFYKILDAHTEPLTDAASHIVKIMVGQQGTQTAPE